MTVQLHNVSHEYNYGKVQALRGINLDIRAGQFVAIMGASGSGKSTLLHLIAGLTQPRDGDVIVLGHHLGKLSDNDLTLFRRRNIGLIFQAFNLLPTMTALENVMLPLIIDGKSKREIRARGEHLLRLVQLTDRMDHRPDELSGGQQQRVAIARALMNEAPVLLADEPTGNLDSKSGEDILYLLRELVERENRTMVMVTHDPRAAAYADRIITLSDGQISEELGIVAEVMVS
ncbi:MAG: ABC transporter ATP-binding protein [Chloroflexi bacterium]|nr:ABC transporter ATP-binding protein [Chloroflexota bacterium]